MTPCQPYFDHLVNLLITNDALKETALDPLWAMSSRLWAIIRDNLIVQKTTTAVTTVRDKYPGLCRIMSSFGAMLGACVAPALLPVVIGGAAGMTLQWVISSAPRLIRKLPIGILARVTWPIAGAIFGFWLFGVLGAIPGCVLFCLKGDRYKTMIGTLIGLTEEERTTLVMQIQGVVGSQQREDITSFISSQSNRKELIRTLYEYSEHPHRQGW
ncbi:uncharacterized protein LOC124117274 isoform X2 [Haliotis rufescens]|uniref:uncharacterized protein LOC124117274 isoform X2 n=1 Tax=Haliotis rufescens TaxID=6454 RepID=UPI00201F44F5|nr:uncharacterized protein LOC124117274 isoform X2 [Haliotis rufescens]